MVLVIQLKWVHIFTWATVLKTQPKTNQRKNPQQTLYLQQNKASKFFQLSVLLGFESYFLRDAVSCQGIERAIKENRCMVLVNDDVKSFCFHIYRTYKPTARLFLPPNFPQLLQVKQ